MRHKRFVWRCGREMGVGVWQLLIHDWDKFLPTAWVIYARTYYDAQGNPQFIKSDALASAQQKHRRRNPHHWQYWLVATANASTVALDMPMKFRREMVADWYAAGLALGKSDIPAWYLANRHEIILHDDTRAWVEAQLGVA